MRSRHLPLCCFLPHMQLPALLFPHTTEPLVTQFIESVDAGELCMLIGACMDGLVASRTPPALPPGLVAALSAAQAKMYTGAANDACDVCKVGACQGCSDNHMLVSRSTLQAQGNSCARCCAGRWRSSRRTLLSPTQLCKQIFSTIQNLCECTHELKVLCVVHSEGVYPRPSHFHV